MRQNLQNLNKPIWLNTEFPKEIGRRNLIAYLGNFSYGIFITKICLQIKLIFVYHMFFFMLIN